MKYFVAILALMFSSVAFSAGPAQIWRMEVTAGQEGIVQIGEIELASSVGGANVTDLLRSFVFDEAAGATTWTIVHNLDIQEKKTAVTVVAVDGLDAPIEPDSITIVDTNTVEIVFAEAATGTAGITGSSFDTPGVDRLGDAVPPNTLFPRRASAVLFDNNVASSWKSRKAPSTARPIAIQYTYWVGDPSRYPTVVEYRVTAPKAENAPRNWRFMYKDGTEWIVVDEVVGATFQDGETKAFSID